MSDLKEYDEMDLYYNTTPEGLIQVIDVMTGEVIRVQKSFHDYLREPDSAQLVKVTDEEGHAMYLEKGIVMDQAKDLTKWKYSPVLAAVFCQKIVEGGTITGTSKQDDFPSYAIIARWRHDHPEFNRMLNQAVLDRAEHDRDAIYEFIQNAEDLDKDSVAGARLKVDSLKWLAEKGNSAKFGAKTTIAGDPDSPVKFVIETGIRRDSDDNFNIDETKKIRDVEEVEDSDGSAESV